MQPICTPAASPRLPAALTSAAGQQNAGVRGQCCLQGGRQSYHSMFASGWDPRRQGVRRMCAVQREVGSRGHPHPTALCPLGKSATCCGCSHCWTPPDTMLAGTLASVSWMVSLQNTSRPASRSSCTICSKNCWGANCAVTAALASRPFCGLDDLDTGQLAQETCCICFRNMISA